MINFKMYFRARLLLGYLVLLMLAGCNENKEKPPLRIATAANMQFAMQELISDFTTRTGIKCEPVISSSGKLTAQIKEGAPYDVFVAADLKYPKAIFNAGMAVDKPEIYAYGKLVLWAYREESLPSLNGLTEEDIHHIALANPKTAPYGSAAISVLKKQHLYDSVEKKLVYGESIAQTNQFITSGAAEMGFTALAVVKSPTLKNKGNWVLIDSHLYDPIAQGVVILKHDSGNQKGAQTFYEYLFSKDAQKILSDFGYSVNE